MSVFAKLSVQSLNVLFNQLSEDEQKVFWVRDTTYNKQIFLSPSYQIICKRSCEELYTYPARWNDFLIGEHSKEFVELLKSRSPKTTEKQQNNTVLYRLRDANHQTIWMKDTHFYLFNNDGQQVGVAGLAQPITEAHWLSEARGNGEPQPTQHKKNLLSILKNELQLTATSLPCAILLDQENDLPRYIITTKGEKISLSSREIECLRHVIQGCSAKEIAKRLGISPRTVELHLAHIKEKAKCQKILKLISMIKEFSV